VYKGEIFGRRRKIVVNLGDLELTRANSNELEEIAGMVAELCQFIRVHCVQYFN
jgi:hypothetical protein